VFGWYEFATATGTVFSFDVTTLIFLALAVFVIWRLRSVLGQKTGHEKPPQDPFRREASEPPQTKKTWTMPSGAPAIKWSERCTAGSLVKKLLWA
jgi:predicted lipid-binding transport protein (Tim44 family)